MVPTRLSKMSDYNPEKKVNGPPYLTKKELIKYSQDKCEFCEEIFVCHYDMLVHNAKHIIIPLSSEIVQCSQCQRHFPTATELKIHSEVDHFDVSNILKNIVMKKPIVQCDSTVIDMIMQDNEVKVEKILNKNDVEEYDSALSDLVKEKSYEKLKEFVTKQPVIHCDDSINIMFTNKCYEPVYSDTNDSFEDLILPTEKKDTKILEDIDSKGIPDENSRESQNSGNIRNRIIFEDDDGEFEDDIISTNVEGLIADMSQHYNEVCDLTLDDSDDENRMIIKTVDIDLTKANNNVPKTAITNDLVHLNESTIPSVHYDDLIIPNLLTCQLCNRAFDNRYDLIIHETRKHLKIKKGNPHFRSQVCRVCDVYIVGNHWTMKRHLSTKHPLYESLKPSTLKTCTVCKLNYYNYDRHSKNYHLRVQNGPKLSNRTSGNADTIPYFLEDRASTERIMYICEMCSLFLRNTYLYKYITVGNYSAERQRIACERCQKMFFEIKLVKLINKHVNAQPSYEYKKSKPAHVSNEDRLKKIRQRLKMIKKNCL